ncbi:L-lactate permease, partial [Staphylococcus pseudintermedius]
VLLLLTRIVAPVKTLTTTVLDLSWTHILGYPTIASSWQLLYSPGTLLFMAAIFAILIQRKSFRHFSNACKDSPKTVSVTGLTTIPTFAWLHVFCTQRPT